MSPSDNFLNNPVFSAFGAQQKQTLLSNLYRELEVRVGDKLAGEINDEQFAQMETFIDQDDHDGLDNWLRQNYPDYEQIVSSELEKLKQEAIANPNKFLQEVV